MAPSDDTDVTPDAPDERPILVVDFGAQYAQLIARRVREAHVYSEIVPASLTPARYAERDPAGIIFSGGPASVHVPGAPTIDPGVYDLGIPILGICYGAQLVALQLGGEVAATGRAEYGRTPLDVTHPDAVLFGGGQPDHQQVWMSHRDSSRSPPRASPSPPPAPTPPSPPWSTSSAASTASSSTPRSSTPRTASRSSSTSSTRSRGAARRGR